MSFPKPLDIYDTGEVVQVEAPLARGPAFIHTVTSEQLHWSSCWMRVPTLRFTFHGINKQIGLTNHLKTC